MAIIWGDGFDHYASRAQMVDGSYVLAGPGTTLSTANPRTGTKHIRIGDIWSSGVEHWRFAYKQGSLTSVGLGFASYLEFIPDIAQSSNWSIDFCDFDNVCQVRCQLHPTGAWRFTRYPDVTPVTLATTGPVITAGAYHHIEIFITISNTVGVIKMRVNNIEVLSVSGIDTQGSALAETSQFKFNGQPSSMGARPAPAWDIDDLYLYDTSGARDNAYPVGDLECILLDTDGDTAEADWALSTGATGYTLTSDFSDATYVQASAVSDRSDFTLQDLPPDINYVACLFFHTRLSKSDASPAQVQASIMSGANRGAGSDRAITTVPTFWHDMFDTDPATGVRWTKSGVDSSIFRIDRTV
jgi:hypothetical protein